MVNGERRSTAMSRQYGAGGPSRRAVLCVFCLLALLLLPLSARAAVPNAPSNLAATPLSSTQIKVTWNDISSDETNFYIEYKESSSTGGYSGTWAGGKDITTYTVINLKQQTLYLFRIRAYNASGFSAYPTDTSATTLPLNAPSELAVSAKSYTQVTLAWKDNSGDESGFYIEGRAEGGAYSRVATVSQNATSYTISNLTQGTKYYYRIQAFNYGNYSQYNYSEFSAEIDVTTKLLNAPTGLTATAVASNEVQLTWTDSSDDETQFYIYRKTSTTDYAQVGSVGAGVTVFPNKNINQATTYTYSVRAYNGGYYSQYADPVSVTTPPLSAPSDLAVSAKSYTQVTLAWKDNSSDESGFYLERLASPGGAAVQTFGAGANAVSYPVSNLTQGTEYFFRVRAYNYGYNPSYNYSAYSNDISVTTLALSAPTNLTAEPVASSQIKLTWTPAADGATHYYIYYKEATAGSYSYKAVNAPASDYTIDNLKQQTEYTFYIKSYNGGNFSQPSGNVTATTPVLAPPSDLAVSSVSYKEATIVWTDTTLDESGFKVERKTGANGTYGLIYTSGMNSTSFRNTGLTPGTEYFYRVQTYRNSYFSVFSEDIPVTTRTFDAPSNLGAEPISSTKVKLAWTDNTIDETNFYIEYKAPTDTAYRHLTTATAGATSIELPNLAPNTKYWFRIRAYGNTYGGYSPYSNETSATTLSFDAPSNLTAVTLSSTQIKLTWQDNSQDETYFYIEYKIAGPGYFYPLTTAMANTTTYTHTNLAPNRTYVYRVYAWSYATGNSAYSNEATATAQDPPPTGLEAAALSSKRIKLTWTDVSGETQYSIEYRSGDADNYSVLTTLPANTTLYAHTGLTAATAYSYRIRAYNGVSYTPYSNAVSTTTPECVEEGTYQP